jgi:subtilisin family serine protease
MNIKTISLIMITSAATLNGCGGGATNSAPTLSAISSQSTAKGVIKTVSINASDSDGDVLTYALTSSPTNTVTGSVSASILTLTPESTFSGTASLTLKVSDGKSEASQSFSLVVTAADPLYGYQWHLNNSGQTNFAANPGTSAEDINVDSVIAEGIKGNDVIVAVVDTGLEIAHEDLSANVVSGGSWDFVGSDSDPTSSSTTGDHGTSVAGLIAATGWNGKGGRGVAPSASLKGFNLISSSQTLANYVSSLGGASYSNDVDIFNQSYGSDRYYSTTINSTIEAQYIYGVSSLRSGKGAIYIKSSGNGFHLGVKISGTSYYCYQLYGGATGLSCQNANMDPSNSIPENIMVGALTAKGKKSSYSTAGSNLWVSAPGGESGTTDPAMLTTDQSNCTQGYVRTGGASGNTFDTVSEGSGHSENSNCNYTSIFNGTSSAAPVTSGAVALMLEANPALTWRDVKHILASTSDQVDATLGATIITINGVAYDAEPAWLTNAAGYKFHNYYGFGRVNVAAAVTAAKAYTAGSLGTFTYSSWASSGTLNTAIQDNDASGLSNAISVSDSKSIEAVQVKINLTHPYTGQLAIELTSPSGSKSMLFNPKNIFASSNGLTNFILLSNAFYGETSNGNWTLKVVDTNSGNTGTLTNWSIRVFGH